MAAMTKNLEQTREMCRQSCDTLAKTRAYGILRESQEEQYFVEDVVDQE